MSDAAIAEISHQAKAIPTRSAPGRVTGKLAQAIDFMVEDGLRWDEAAVKVGLTVRTMRLALERSHVLAHLRQRKHVLREAASAANIVRLTQIRDAADNMPAVNAIKLLEELGDDHSQRQSGLSASPGVTIRIVNVVQQAPAQTYPSDMSRPNVNQINGLAEIGANAASAGDRGMVDATPAIPASAHDRGRGEK